MRVRFISGVAIATFVGCACGMIWAQDAINSESTKLQMMAKDADPDWEVVTVKPSNTDEKGDRIVVQGRHLIVKNETVEAMLVTGFNVQKSQIVGVPDWVRTERWDVDGLPNVEGQPDIQQLQSMLRKMLEERFGLKLAGGPHLHPNPKIGCGCPTSRF